ncbi:hypothetical protein [Acinetobacter bereziniae]|nr:hypothetical protein [Acinetobacter bereziniae]
MNEEIYKEVHNQYFESDDFNSMPIYQLKEKFDIQSDQFRMPMALL